MKSTWQHVLGETTLPKFVIWVNSKLFSTTAEKKEKRKNFLLSVSQWLLGRIGFHYNHVTWSVAFVKKTRICREHRKRDKSHGRHNEHRHLHISHCFQSCGIQGLLGNLWRASLEFSCFQESGRCLWQHHVKDKLVCWHHGTGEDREGQNDFPALQWGKRFQFVALVFLCCPLPFDPRHS